MTPLKIGVAVNVVHWDAATCTWTQPVVLDRNGYMLGNGRQIQIAFDKKTGTIGVANRRPLNLPEAGDNGPERHAVCPPRR